MAMTAESLRGPLRFMIDLTSGLIQQPIRQQLMKGDKKANAIVVVLTEDKEPVDLSGVTVTGSFISPMEGAEIPLSGSTNGSEAWVTLPDECYAEEGHFEANVVLTVGETSRTILSITGHVLSKGSGAVIDIGGVIPNISDIIAQYAAMKQAVEETNAARDSANEAAKNAPYVNTSNNHWMSWDTETGKYIDTGVNATGPQGPKGDPGMLEGTAVDSEKLGGKTPDAYILHDDALTLEEIAASTDLAGKVASAEAASQLYKKGSTIKVLTAADAVPTNTWVKAENSYYLEKGDYLLVIPFCRDQGGYDEFFERRLALDTASTYSDDAALSSVGGNWSNAGLGSVVINVPSAATYNLFLKHYGTETHRIDIRGHFIKL